MLYRVTDVAGQGSAAPRSGGRHDFLLVVVGTGVLQLLLLVTGVITARLLGVEGRGVVALVFALGLLGSQLTWGGSAPTALAKNLAQRHVGARDGLRGIVRRRGWLLVPPCLVTGAVMAWLQRDAATLTWLGLGAAVSVMTAQTIASRLLIASLQGEVGRLPRMVAVSLLPQLLFAITLSVAFVAGWTWSTGAVLVAFFVASTVGLLAGLPALSRPTHDPADRLDEAQLWRDTRATYVSSVRPLDSIGLDRILVGGLLGTVSLGLYAAAAAVASLGGTVGNAVAIIVLPQVARAHDDPAAQRSVARRWLALTAVSVLVIIAVIETVVDPLIRVAFGPEFGGAVDVARWLIVADALFGFRKVLLAVLQGQGRGGLASWIELSMLPLLVLGIAVASWRDSLVGIGISLTVIGVLSCVVLGLAVARGPRDRGRRASRRGARRPIIET